MIVFDNLTPAGRDVGPVRAYPKRMGAALHTDAVARKVAEVAQGRAKTYARRQDKKNNARFNAFNA